MTALNLPPEPALPIIHNVPSVGQDNRDEKRVNDGVVNNEQAAVEAKHAEEAGVGKYEKALEREKIYEHLGNLAMSAVPKKGTEEYDAYVLEYGDADGNLPKAEGFRQKHFKNAMDRKVARLKRSAAINGTRTSTSSGSKNANWGRKAQIPNLGRLAGIQLSPNLDRKGRKIARGDLKGNPISMPSREQKEARKAVSTKQKRVDNYRNNAAKGHKKAVRKIVKAHKKEEKAKSKGELFTIKREVVKADIAANRANREYNKNAKAVNKDRREYIWRTWRADSLDRSIDNLGDKTSKRAVRKLARKETSLATHKRKIQENIVRSNAARSKSTGLVSGRAVAEYHKNAVRKYFEDLGNNNVMSLDQAVEAISYADIASSVEERSRMEIHTRNKSEHGLDYARTLKALVMENGMPKLKDVSEKAIEQMKVKLANVGIDSSRYGESLSWVLWDIAKQMYYVNNPGEADPNYRIANPLEDPVKMQEIIDRHVGWEIYRAIETLPFADRMTFAIDHGLNKPEIIDILDKPPKPGIGLSSKDLADLGSKIR